MTKNLRLPWHSWFCREWGWGPFRCCHDACDGNRRITARYVRQDTATTRGAVSADPAAVEHGCLAAELERAYRTILGVEGALRLHDVAITSPLSDAVVELCARVEQLEAELANAREDVEYYKDQAADA